jgi:hypothetical protein
MSNQVSNPYRTIDKIIVFNILIFIFFNSKQEDGRFWTEWLQALPEFMMQEDRRKIN